jgi:hypothetical protein
MIAGVGRALPSIPLRASLSAGSDEISKISKDLSFRSAALSREESAASTPAASRFLADEPGFGMTTDEAVDAQTRDYPASFDLDLIMRRNS